MTSKVEDPEAIAHDADADFGLTKELLEDIHDQKEKNPSMFVSAWQDDMEGVSEKNENDPTERWLTAAEENELSAVQSFLKNDPLLLNVSDADGYTALHRASYNNHCSIVKFLLASGADIESRTNEGWTPLHSASNWSNFEIVGILLSNGANVNALSKGNLTALHLAVNSRSETVEDIYHTVNYLLQAPGIDAGAVAGNGDTPLMIARRTSERVYNDIQNFLEKP